MNCGMPSGNSVILHMASERPQRNLDALVDDVRTLNIECLIEGRNIILKDVTDDVVECVEQICYRHGVRFDNTPKTVRNLGIEVR